MIAPLKPPAQPSEAPTISEISRDEFIRRFVDRMIAIAGEKDGEGNSVREYAEMTAPTYWEDLGQRADGPEECAEVDLSYWE